MKGVERVIERPRGCLAYKSWGPAEGSPVLALHGWMDNAGTFDVMAPRLAGLRLIALDLPGHGLSDPRAAGSEYYIWSYVEDVLDAAEHFGLQRFDLLGHSMGGIIACLLAALYPERVNRLALLDSVGPLTTAPDKAVAQMRRALQIKRAGESRARLFPSLEAAEAARAEKGISAQSARLLAARGVSQDADGQWFWHGDRRLARPNLLSMTERQAATFLRAISCPTLLVSARQFWEGERRAVYERRLPHFRTLELLELDGNHYQHLEGAEVERVVERVQRFLSPGEAPHPP